MTNNKEKNQQNGSNGWKITAIIFIILTIIFFLAYFQSIKLKELMFDLHINMKNIIFDRKNEKDNKGGLRLTELQELVFLVPEDLKPIYFIESEKAEKRAQQKEIEAQEKARKEAQQA